MNLIPGVQLPLFVQIGLLIVAVVILWGILSAVFKMAIRLFTFGCSAILIIGVILLALRYFGKL